MAQDGRRKNLASRFTSLLSTASVRKHKATMANIVVIFTHNGQYKPVGSLHHEVEQLHKTLKHFGSDSPHQTALGGNWEARIWFMSVSSPTPGLLSLRCIYDPEEIGGRSQIELNPNKMQFRLSLKSREEATSVQLHSHHNSHDHCHPQQAVVLFPSSR